MALAIILKYTLQRGGMINLDLNQEWIVSGRKIVGDYQENGDAAILMGRADDFSPKSQ
jgi:hypothetical protein